MRAEIVLPDGDLKREVWSFNLSIDYSTTCIYLEYYSFDTKETARHKWRTQNHWGRFDRRNNNIDGPPLPMQVETEMRRRYQERILTIPIKR